MILELPLASIAWDMVVQKMRGVEGDAGRDRVQGRFDHGMHAGDVEPQS
ncbi:MAG: hypothetical protein PHV11_09220 [Candidatus Bipolaricaulis sp.]|nr:hypothetical protein [Candidatus Bipolaricaulis sp.]